MKNVYFTFSTTINKWLLYYIILYIILQVAIYIAFLYAINFQPCFYFFFFNITLKMLTCSKNNACSILTKHTRSLNSTISTGKSFYKFQFKKNLFELVVVLTKFNCTMTNIYSISVARDARCKSCKCAVMTKVIHPQGLLTDLDIFVISQKSQKF